MRSPCNHRAAFLDEDDNVCLVCEDGWVVVLATGEMYELGSPDKYMVKLINAKVVIE